MLTEQRILKQVTCLPASGIIQVQWADQILRDGEVISETFHRNSYTEERKTEFLADVENAAAYVTAIGWEA